MEQEIMRIGVSLPENLLTKFGYIITQRGYSSRSEGIRDAIRNYIIHHEWMSDLQGERVGVITMVYSQAQHGLVDSLIDIQHDLGKIVHSSLHAHMDHGNYLGAIVLKDEDRNLKKDAGIRGQGSILAPIIHSFQVELARECGSVAIAYMLNNQALLKHC